MMGVQERVIGWDDVNIAGWLPVSEVPGNRCREDASDGSVLPVGIVEIGANNPRVVPR